MIELKEIRNSEKLNFVKLYARIYRVLLKARLFYSQYPMPYIRKVMAVYKASTK